MHSFTERTACITEQFGFFFNYSPSTKKTNYLFCSSSSSFLFIMATIAWRSSSEKRKQKGLRSVTIIAHFRSRSHVHRQHHFRWCQHHLLSGKHIKMLLLSSLIWAIFQRQSYLTPHQKYWSNQISLHLALIQMFTSVPVVAAVLFSQMEGRKHLLTTGLLMRYTVTCSASPNCCFSWL